MQDTLQASAAQSTVGHRIDAEIVADENGLTPPKGYLVARRLMRLGELGWMYGVDLISEETFCVNRTLWVGLSDRQFGGFTRIGGSSSQPTIINVRTEEMAPSV